MTIDFSCYSHIGRRQNNEDAQCALQTPSGFLCVVADGLGGHKNGEYAAQLAVETLRRCLDRQARLSEDLMEDTIIRANADIFALQKRWPEAQTTIAALWVQGESAIAATVGDTRIYQFRNREILFQSTDHSVAQLAVIAGEITPRQIRDYPKRNQLTRSLGWEDEPWIDICTLSVKQGDRFLVCSDGFWEELTEEQMLDLAARFPDAGAWLQSMRAEVQPGASDNNTAVTAVITSLL